MKILFFILLFFAINKMYAQEDGKDIFDIIRESIELEKEDERKKIKTYDDIVCTYWAKEIDETGSPIMNMGYVFLPNNTVLVVRTFFEFFDDNNLYGIYNIYSINSICTYKVVDGKIIFEFGTAIAYLDEGYLYISYNENEFEKYCLEQKFSNYLDDEFF